MTTIPLPWRQPPLTKNRVRRMHHHAEANARRIALEEAGYSIRAAHLAPMPGAIVILHWRMANKRRQDGDGAAPTLAVCIDALVKQGILSDDSWVEVPHSGVTCHPPEPGQLGAMWLDLIDPDGAA